MGIDYIEVCFVCRPFNADEMDILAAFLCEFGYESFVTTNSGMKAYINKDVYQSDNIATALQCYNFSAKITWVANEIKGDDWNASWEQDSFKPIVIGEQCVVHATYHSHYPKCKYDIIIDPKMSFGSGHHETTSMMLEALLEADMKGKNVIDMGAGTGILSIMASKLGAQKVVGVEIDAGAWQNAVDNATLNNAPIEMILGDANSLPSDNDCDFFLANINRNIIINDIDKYSKTLRNGAKLFISGFYEADLPILCNKLSDYNLQLEKHTVRNEWTMAVFGLK
ncbi:MAG: 50S ribosomal protein L11 methyltransferase [Muribaculaceae bacterium]